MRIFRSSIAAISLIAVSSYLAGLLGIAGPVFAQSSAIPGQWQGTYYYPSGDKRAPVPFTMQLRVDGTAVSGRISEPATFGNGSSPFLYGNISGNISGRNISFTKTYDGTGGVSHSVQYRGAINEDGSIISGTWNIRTFSGSFNATAISPGR